MTNSSYNITDLVRDIVRLSRERSGAPGRVWLFTEAEILSMLKWEINKVSIPTKGEVAADK